MNTLVSHVFITLEVSDVMAEKISSLEGPQQVDGLGKQG
jgi:hypothetical protein